LSPQWYPGHMASAMRAIRENTRLVDVVIEVVDARAPRISRDPGISRISSKPRVIALAKADLADPIATQQWIEQFKSEGTPAYPVDARSGEGVADLLRGCRLLFGERARQPASGGGGRPMRVMVVGVPNVGKSSLINRMTSGASARTGAMPGVTRGKQWVRTMEGIEVLDLPGVLRPGRIAGSESFKLALLGIIPETAYDPSDVMVRAIQYFSAGHDERHDGILAWIRAGEKGSPEEALLTIGKRKGFLKKGGEIDVFRTAAWVINQVREGKAGRLSLETP